jgi:hypothetical protein
VHLEPHKASKGQIRAYPALSLARNAPHTRQVSTVQLKTLYKASQAASTQPALPLKQNKIGQKQLQSCFNNKKKEKVFFSLLHYDFNDHVMSTAWTFKIT